MLNIVQSNKIEVLFQHLLMSYQQPKNAQSVFESFDVIVPSMVMGDWLKKQIADKVGISALITTEFWGRYQLNLMQRVLRTYARYAEHETIKTVPEVAMLSKKVMQWQIFGYCLANKESIVQDSQHPLHEFLSPIYQDIPPINNTSQPVETDMIWTDNQSLLANNQLLFHANQQTFEQRLWQFANDMANMLNRYMTYRPTWLANWQNNQPLPIEKMIADKDYLQNRLQGRTGDNKVNTPDWLVEHYIALEKAQRFLWHTLFIGDYQYREVMHQQFWQAFSHQNPDIQQKCCQLLPKNLILFTVQQLPPNELIDLQRLGELTEVTLLHFNPSQQFWADIVDKNWLLQQQIDNPQAIYLKDYGHTLLSRFGKQSREVFAMLANLSGNEYQRIDWQDNFVNYQQPNSLLEYLQQDILMLEEIPTQQKIQEMLSFDTVSATNLQIEQLQKAGFNNQQALTKILQKLQQEKHQKQGIWRLPKIDTSLSIHACHSTLRQLEVLRSMIIGWLNYTDIDENERKNYQQIPENQRNLSDILVLLPDIDAQQNSIEAIFPKGVGIDGYHLPAKVTGVVAKEINQLWKAITGYYQLLNQAGARFNKIAVFDWLMLPPMYESFGLSLADMKRACDLLEEAGFIRGFDEAHLQQTLHTQDDDYRYTFAFALERLVAGVLMPNAEAVMFGEFTNHFGETEKIRPLSNVSMNDTTIVAVLCEIFQTLHENRDMGKCSHSVKEWLGIIEALIQKRFANFTRKNAMLAIFSAQNQLNRTIEASQKHHQYFQELPFRLNFILQSIAEQLTSQQVSAEPAGVITFARIGAVRNIPFKLVALLNMNLSDFPQREPNNRYNLMQAGIAKRGDKFREDDDLGAFLDAILCADEACWLFYNGKSTADNHEYLPASPVQELLSFLQTEIEIKNSLSKSNRQLSFGQQVEQYLVNHHPVLPFDKQYFQYFGAKPVNETNLTHYLQQEKSQIYPPAEIWYNIYQQLSDKNTDDGTQQMVIIWQLPQLQSWLVDWKKLKKLESWQNNQISVENIYMSANTIIQGLQNPAKSFIKNQHLFLLAGQTPTLENEPLILDNLTNYQLKTKVLDDDLTGKVFDKNTTFIYNDLLPVGIGRYRTLQDVRDHNISNLTKFLEKIQSLDSLTSTKGISGLQRAIVPILQLIPPCNDTLSAIQQLLTPCQEQRLRIDTAMLVDNGEILSDNHSKNRYILALNLPQMADNQEGSPIAWIDYLPNGDKTKHLLRFWISHLCWQVARLTNDEQITKNDGFSLWQFSDKKMYYLPAIHWQQAYAYLQDWLMIWQLSQKQVVVLPPDIVKQYLQKDEKKVDKSVWQQLSDWHQPPFYNQSADESCFYHKTWQMLLNNQSPMVILPFLQIFGEYLYQPMLDYLVEI